MGKTMETASKMSTTRKSNKHRRPKYKVCAVELAS